jgi:hypothetical protein
MVIRRALPEATGTACFPLEKPLEQLHLLVALPASVPLDSVVAVRFRDVAGRVGWLWRLPSLHSLDLVSSAMVIVSISPFPGRIDDKSWRPRNKAATHQQISGPESTACSLMDRYASTTALGINSHINKSL